jgi:hypothetical protein
MCVNPTAIGSSNALIATWEPNGLSLNFASATNSKSSLIEASAYNRYSIKELTTFKAGLLKKINSNNCLLFSLSRLNNVAFAEQSFETGIAKRLSQKFCTGLKLEYRQWLLEDSRYTGSHAVIPEISFVVNALPSICLGVIVNNPVQTRINSSEIDRLPATILTGVAAKISSRLLFGISAETSTGSEISYNTGIEYKYAQQLMVRAGFSSYPVSQSFGFQLSISKYDLALAVESNPSLGISSAVSIVFHL